MKTCKCVRKLLCFLAVECFSNGFLSVRLVPYVFGQRRLCPEHCEHAGSSTSGDLMIWMQFRATAHRVMLSFISVVLVMSTGTSVDSMVPLCYFRVF